MKKFLNIFFIPLIFASVIPSNDGQANQELTTENNHQNPVTLYYDNTAPQYVFPGYYYPTTYIPEHVYAPPEVEVEEVDESRLVGSVEPSTIALLVKFLLIPALVLKFIKSVIFGLSAVTTIGVAFFLLSATLCAFTNFCIIGLAIPGLRSAERSGRSFVQQISGNVPGEKIEAAAEILSNVLDKYAKIRISQSKKKDVLKSDE